MSGFKNFMGGILGFLKRSSISPSRLEGTQITIKVRSYAEACDLCGRIANELESTAGVTPIRPSKPFLPGQFVIFQGLYFKVECVEPRP